MPLIPALITVGILGGIYLWAPREATPISGGSAPPAVIPPEQIPTQLSQRMQSAFVQLPPQLQQQLPPAAWGDPNLWAQAAQVLNTLQPGSPQSPELLAISNALRQLGVPQPIPIPQPGPIPLPPALGAQLQQVLNGLPPPFNQVPGMQVPFPPREPGSPLPPITVDPASILLLAQQIEAAIPGRNEPAQLRAIAAQLASTRAPAPMNGGAMMFAAPNGQFGQLRTLGGVLPVAQEAAQTYRDILALRDTFRGVPSRVAGEPSAYALHPTAFQRRRYSQAFR